MRTTVILDDALFQEATRSVLADWLLKNEPPPRGWKTVVIEEALHALLRDKHVSRRRAAWDQGVSQPKTLTLIVDEPLLRRAEGLVTRELSQDNGKARIAGMVINHGLRALLRERAARRLASHGPDAHRTSKERRERTG